jgi:hypothetical protein
MGEVRSVADSSTRHGTCGACRRKMLSDLPLCPGGGRGHQRVDEDRQDPVAGVLIGPGGPGMTASEDQGGYLATL